MVSGFRKVHQEKWFRIRASCESMSTCKKKKPNHRTFWQFRSPTLRPKPRNFVKVGVICKPQTNTRDVILGAACMSLGPVTPNVHIFKICQDAPKKNGASFRLLKRNQNGFLFWREPAHAKCAATDRFFQPKLKNSVVWAILFRVVFDFVQNAHEKNTCYFCNAMNLLILSVFMLDRQT